MLNQVAGNSPPPRQELVFETLRQPSHFRSEGGHDTFNKPPYYSRWRVGWHGQQHVTDQYFAKTYPGEGTARPPGRCAIETE